MEMRPNDPRGILQPAIRSTQIKEERLESPVAPCRYAFLTLPNYSLIAVSNAVEPLRMANRLVGRDVYQWSVVSLDGLPQEASSGLNLSPTVALESLGPVDIIFVC